MYALNLDADNRILSVTFEEYATDDMPRVRTLPDGDISEHKYVDGEYVHDPLSVEPEVEQPTQLDKIEAQVAYTAMMTDTLVTEV